MTIYFRKISFYLAMAGITCLVILVRTLAQVPPMPAPPIAPVQKPGLSAIAASGLVEAQNENTKIGVPVPGLITEVKVQVWDKVKVGDILLRLDDRDLQAQLLAQSALVNVAEASLKRVEDQLTRLQAVGKSGAVTEDEISTRRNDAEVARAQLASARATVNQTHLLLERLTVRAPIDGTILQVNTRAGEYAALTAKDPLILMGQLDLLQIRADVDEQLAPRIKEAMGGIAWVKGDSTHPIDLQFVRIEPFIIPKVSLTGSSSERVDTRVLQVIFTMRPNATKKVYVGQQMDLFLTEAAAPEK